MNGYLRLSVDSQSDGPTDIITNDTKNNYVNLGGRNNKETLLSFCAFMYRFDIWNKNDKLSRYKGSKKTIMKGCNDISFVLVFYNRACATYEATNQKQLSKADMSSA